MERGIILLAMTAGLTMAISGRTEPVCQNRTDGATLSCFTCLGRDSDNCESGTTCCKGSCFKLIDKEHDLIAKGCTNQREEDGSMKRRTLDVQLYWAADQRITGESYFCSKQEFCNSAISLNPLTLSTLSTTIAVILLSVFLV